MIRVFTALQQWVASLDRDWQAVLVSLFFLCFVLAGGTIPW
ncbi:hypothetical protein ACFFQF_07985 [Haladaptatus pallidirubidus]|nr:hypothetical protein [Haladaptatus pallidirubidus]